MDTPSAPALYRPQFHFTARENWINDPNGLVFYKGEYHLFFQHNPSGLNWGNMTWGHAVSSNLVHWQQLPHALETDALGMMFSGSAVVDWRNTAGFQRGPDPALVAVYTASGSALLRDKAPDTQCLACSHDCGRTWTKFAGNPVVPQITAGNRDPKVFWHAPTQRWIMALYVGQPGAHETCHTIEFLNSPDLKTWTRTGGIEGFYECPDLFELPVEGAPGETRWVLFAADGRYRIGHFDGMRFVPGSAKLTGDWGANFYAGQTYSDVPAADGRRILIAWMRGGNYPGMPFNQQMTFPCELRLHAFPEGPRLCRMPVREIEEIQARTHRVDPMDVAPGEDPLAGIEGDLLDIAADIEIGTASEVGLVVRGHRIAYLAGDRVLCVGGRCAPLAPLDNGRVRLRVLLDRASVEVFANDGRVAFSNCFLPRPEIHGTSFFASGGTARVFALEVRMLDPGANSGGCAEPCRPAGA
jgi:sucrose-6-phosphate hydrolase SacC (GH32 family)